MQHLKRIENEEISMMNMRTNLEIMKKVDKDFTSLKSAYNI